MNSDTHKIWAVARVEREQTIGSGHVEIAFWLCHPQEVSEELFPSRLVVGLKVHAVVDHSDMLKHLMTHDEVEEVLRERKIVIDAAHKVIGALPFRPKKAAAPAVRSPCVVSQTSKDIYVDSHATSYRKNTNRRALRVVVKASEKRHRELIDEARVDLLVVGIVVIIAAFECFQRAFMIMVWKVCTVDPKCSERVDAHWQVAERAAIIAYLQPRFATWTYEDERTPIHMKSPKRQKHCS